MKVAIVLPPGGVFAADRPNSMETVVRTLVPHAPDKDSFQVFCDEGAAVHGDIPVHTVRPGPGRHGRLVKALREFGPDVIEFHQHTITAARLARRFPEAVRLLYRHNDVKPPRNAFDAARYACRYRQFEGLIFVSDASREAFLAAYPALATRAFTVRNAIDAELWAADPEERDKLIVFAGRAMPEKGLDILCDALPGVLDRHPDWRAELFLGDWDKQAQWATPHVERLLSRTGRVTVRRHAPLSEVRTVMQRAAIAVVPSVWAEPLGLAALEAHAAGAALVSSGRGGLREASGPHAVYVEPLDDASLAAALDALIDTPERRLALARDGQEFVIREHSPTARALELALLRDQLADAR